MLDVRQPTQPHGLPRAELGIEHVWMNHGPGAGSVSETATAYGRKHGITVIDGGCPCMFGQPPTAATAMRLVFTLTGNVPRTSELEDMASWLGLDAVQPA